MVQIDDQHSDGPFICLLQAGRLAGRLDGLNGLQEGSLAAPCKCQAALMDLRPASQLPLWLISWRPQAGLNRICCLNRVTNFKLISANQLEYQPEEGKPILNEFSFPANLVQGK